MILRKTADNYKPIWVVWAIICNSLFLIVEELNINCNFVVSPLKVDRVSIPLPLTGFGKVICFTQWNAGKRDTVPNLS